MNHVKCSNEGYQTYTHSKR